MPFNSKRAAAPHAAASLLLLALTASAGAQTTAPAGTPAPAATNTQVAAPPAAPVPVAGARASLKAPKPERCMRLPLSDVAFGKEGSIAAARVKLDEYAAAEAKRRGWAAAPLVKSAEKVGECSVYLDFGPLVGTEYRCLVTATYCQK